MSARPGGWALRGVLFAGLGAFALTGGPALPLAVGTALLLVAPGPRLSANAWAVLHGLVLLVTGVTALLIAPTTGFAILVAWLLAHRAWIGRTGDDARVALLLSTLLLLLGAIGTESVFLGPLLVVYAALLPVALLRAELHDAGEAPPPSLQVLVGGGAALLTGALFVVLPRLDGGYVGHGPLGGPRFPEDVTLGEEGLVNDDGAEVMRVRVTSADGSLLPGPFHLRGRALDHFDGARWSATTRPEGAPVDAPWDRRADVRLEPIAGEVVFSVPDLLRVDGIAVRAEAGGTLVPLMPARSVQYTAYARDVPLARVARVDIDPWLQLPEDLDPRISTLALTVVPPEETDPVRIARGLTDWLATTYAYVDTPPAPVGDPLAWFLFDAKEGHCEYFATALAIMLRVRDVPARLATGFHSGELAEDGEIVVRRGNAHAWVEVRTEGGWATLDPTPPSERPYVDPRGLRARFDALVAAWYRDVVEYDMDAQFSAYGALGKRVLLAGGGEARGPVGAGLVGMLATMTGIVVAFVVGRAALGWYGVRRAPRPDVGARLCAEARAIVRGRGWNLPGDLPMLEAAAWLEARAGADAAPLRRLAEIVYASRYGGGPLATGEARACVRALRRMPKAGRRRDARGGPS